ncbi:hypothetical protein UPYG_G00026760 [Umbra pygmaea]|uniref:Spermatogenesis-associated protein 6 N-terminal domain-containing protein n=1 Tax=Umbra pygmaea TaxID=75934 RepID=A0ABD0XQ00_UMBPY
MGRLTNTNKEVTSFNMSHKGLKCTVQIDIQAITCPGVMLPNPEDVYLSVCIMGQFNNTACLPPVFPLLFHEKMTFVKRFTGVADPGYIADLLEADTTSFELIQLVPPEGNILATIEANTRDFLYPCPKMTALPRAGGPEREMLMRRSISFPGISPKVEFASTSVIEECDGRERLSQPRLAYPPCSSPSLAKKSPARRRPDLGAGGSSERQLKGQQLNWSRPSSEYRKATVSSQAHALSPYTHRRMCQLSKEATQRLSHFKLGPYRFKKETEPQVPFVVSHTLSASVIETPSRFSSTKKSLPNNTSTSFAENHSGNSSLNGRYRPVQVGPICLTTQKSPGKSSITPVRVARSALAAHSSTPALGSGSPQLSPLLSRSSLRERFHSTSSPSEEIHRRVQKILHTHAANRTLQFHKDNPSTKQGPQHSCEDNPSTKQGPQHPCEDALLGNRAFQEGMLLEDTSISLDDKHIWSIQAARYTGKPHRAVFEESLARIYKNMYKKASCT